MRRAMLGLAAAIVVLSAGPVGAWLGLELGRTELSARTRYDSIHYYLPSPADSTATTNYRDSTVVVAETLLGQGVTWVSQTSVSGDTSLVLTDTAWESGDSALCSLWRLGDSTRTETRYRVPFALGSWWRSGVAGTYLADINADSLIDTLTVWADTTRVIDTEDVFVPYGPVEHCYKLRTTLRQSVALTLSGVPVRETSLVRAWQWYKDSLCRAKDSTVVTGTGYTKVIIWLRALDFVSTTVGRLEALWTGIAGPAEPLPAPGRLSVLPNPCRGTAVLRLSEPADGPARVSIYSAAGRLVRPPAPCRSSSMWLDLADLPTATYLVRVRYADGRSLTLPLALTR